MKKLQLLPAGSRADRFLYRQLASPLFSHRVILSMLGPLILDSFFINLIGVLTTSMISTSSQESVSAVSLVNPVTNLVMALMSAIASGGTVIVAQYKGHGDNQKVVKAAGQTLLATTLTAVAVGTVLIVFADPVVHMMFGTADALVLKKARDYMIGSCISLILHSVYAGVFGVFRGVGATKVCLWLTIIVNAAYLFASVLFLNVLKLDIVGTALSLNIARFIGAAVALCLLVSPRGILPVSFRDIFRFDKGMMQSIFRMGIPFSVEQLFFNGGAILVQMYMVTLGTVAVAANAVASSAFGLLYSAGSAVSTLTITVVGQCVGSNNRDLARWYGKKMNLLGTAVCLLSIAVLYPMMPLILQMYSPQPETLGVISQLVLIGVIGMPFFWSMSNIMPNVLRSAGDANYPTVVSLITMWALRVGAGYLFAVALGLGIQAVWFCMVAEWAVRTVAFWLRFRGKKWLEKKVIE